MANEKLDSPILVMIKDELNRLPTPTECTITQVHTDGYVDVKTKKGSITHIKKYGNTATVGAEGVIIFIDNDFNKPIVVI